MPLQTPLNIAFCYESHSKYRSLGYTSEQCAEFDTDDTLDAIESSLKSLGHSVIRIGDIEQLVKSIANGDYAEWDLAFSISEGFRGTAREAQIPGLLEAYNIPRVFSDAATLALCHDKGRTKVYLHTLSLWTSIYLAFID